MRQTLRHLRRDLHGLPNGDPRDGLESKGGQLIRILVIIVATFLAISIMGPLDTAIVLLVILIILNTGTRRKR